MVKYVVTALVAIYCVLLVFGEDSRRPEITRQAADDVTGLSLASFSLPKVSNFAGRPDSPISEAEAVRIALKTGEDIRAARERDPLRGLVAAVEAEPDDEPSAVREARDLWYVTGTRVNLRAGPGTGSAVIGQVGLGDAAEVLSDSGGWYRIRTGDGTLTGWIYGDYLDPSRPG